LVRLHYSSKIWTIFAGVARGSIGRPDLFSDLLAAPIIPGLEDRRARIVIAGNPDWQTKKACGAEATEAEGGEETLRGATGHQNR
jgi:hypothetical protein